MTSFTREIPSPPGTVVNIFLGFDEEKDADLIARMENFLAGHLNCQRSDAIMGFYDMFGMTLHYSGTAAASTYYTIEKR